MSHDRQQARNKNKNQRGGSEQKKQRSLEDDNEAGLRGKWAAGEMRET